jgi:hypothetical protein
MVKNRNDASLSCSLRAVEVCMSVDEALRRVGRSDFEKFPKVHNKLELYSNTMVD